MHNTSAPRPQFNAVLLADDMAARGWLAIDLARRARVSHMTVSRFLRSERQTAKTAMKLAKALGYPTDRYLVRSEAVA
jgi:transcriptional regulator with XRE-family HTH domain